MTGAAAIFLDKDGTLLDDVPYNVDPDAMRLAPGAREALSIFSALALPIFVISNQSGVARGRFPIESLNGVEAKLHELFAKCGATLSAVYWCPHDAEGTVEPFNHECDCRKPMPGMLLRAAREHGVVLADSWFIGDILDDIEAGRRAGCRTILIDNGNETVWRGGALREPHVVASDMFRAALSIRDAMDKRVSAREIAR
jgi:histidinol-phosphate phosphatase family protein